MLLKNKRSKRGSTVEESSREFEIGVNERPLNFIYYW